MEYFDDVTNLSYSLDFNDSIGIANYSDSEWIISSSNRTYSSISHREDSSGSSSSVAQQVLDWFNLYYLGAIIIVGVLGNARNVYGFISNRRDLRSPSYYLASLALTDVVFLAIIFILWLNHFEIELFATKGYYETFFFFSSASSSVSAWLVAAFTFERLIVVRYPLKRPVICTVRRAKVIIGSLTIAILIVQTISLFTTDVIKIRLVGSRWRELMPYINKAMHIFNIFESFLTQVVPPVLIVVMNGFIIHGLARLNQTFQAGSNKHRSSSVSANHSHCRKITSIRMATIRTGGVLASALASEGITEYNRQPPTSNAILENNNTKKDDDKSQGIASDSPSSVSNSSNSHAAMIHRVNTFAIVESHQRRSASLSSIFNRQSLPSLANGNCYDSLRRITRPSCDITSSGAIEMDESNVSLAAATAASVIDNCNEESADVLMDSARNVKHQLSEGLACCAAAADEQDEIIIRDDTRNNIINGGVYHARQETLIDMDDIEQAEIMLLPETEENNEVEVATSNTSAAVVDQQLQQSVDTLSRTNGVELNNRASLPSAVSTAPTSNASTEYSITKKLVIISTVHILLNLPSYVISLKVFIDDTFKIKSDENSSLISMLQQYSMVLYYTNFSINFLLYSTSSATFNYTSLQLFKCCRRS